MFRLRPLLSTTLVAAALAALPACGDDDDGHDHDPGGAADSGVDCSTVTGTDAFALGLAKTGANGYTVEITTATPAPPAKGDNRWEVRVTDTEAAAATGMTLLVTTWMPFHQHGSPIPTVVSEGADGTYTLDPINLFMPGVWEITVRVADGDNPTDSVLFTFCISG
jgi:hypothetical protein